MNHDPPPSAQEGEENKLISFSFPVCHDSFSNLFDFDNAMILPPAPVPDLDPRDDESTNNQVLGNLTMGKKTDCWSAAVDCAVESCANEIVESNLHKQSVSASPVDIYLVVEDMAANLAHSATKNMSRLETLEAAEVPEKLKIPGPDRAQQAKTRGCQVAKYLDSKLLDLQRKNPPRKNKEPTQPSLSSASATRGSTPSRFCHLCTRITKQELALICGNVEKGTCRKVICWRCVKDFCWDWDALKANTNWICTHCRSACPPKAQCFTYKRVNQNRRVDGKRKRA